MKKYLQITVVLGIFFAVVLYRAFVQQDNENPVIGNQSERNTSSVSPKVEAQNMSAQYKDGIYTGPVEDVFYGNLQVQVIISGGKISDIQFLQYPNDNPTSRSINEQSNAMLRSEAIQAQSAQVDIVSGASDSSTGFQKSLAGALAEAK